MAQGLDGRFGVRVSDCVSLSSLPQPPRGWSVREFTCFASRVGLGLHPTFHSLEV